MTATERCHGDYYIWSGAQNEKGLVPRTYIVYISVICLDNRRVCVSWCVGVMLVYYATLFSSLISK